MKISSQNASFLASISVIILFFSVASSSAARLISSKATHQVDIKQLCSKGGGSSYCIEFLSSLPGAATAADLPTLCKIAINYAVANATSTSQLIKSLLGKPGPIDPGLKEHLTSCSSHFDSVLGYLQDALTNLASGAGRGGGFTGAISHSVQGAMLEADQCMGEIGIAYQGELYERSKDMDSICDVIQIIADQIPT